jgi:hypothetical protein
MGTELAGFGPLVIQAVGPAELPATPDDMIEGEVVDD